MTLTIAGTIIQGQGDAAANHRVLIPRIAARFPEVRKCSAFGTINIRLDEPLDRSHADFWTPQIPWIPVQLAGAKPPPRPEAFGFIRIKFECPAGGANYSAWIMLPEGASLTYREDQAEIIADELIVAVSYGVRCAIHLDHHPALPAPAWFGKTYGKSFNRTAT